MAKNNWTGGSGWTAISDPTGLLTGRVLEASAGVTQYAEDYLTTVVGTTTAFTYDHYAVTMNYAMPTFVSSTTFSGASLGIVSRASALTTTTPITAQDCYIGRISPKDGTAEIVRRNSGEDEIIASAILPSSTQTFGVLHTMRFNTFGTSPVTLQLLVDDTELVNVGDSSSSALTTGYPGIQMQGGTTYIDNFTIFQYSSSGGGGYNGIYPNQIFDTAVGTTSTFMLMWLRADQDVSTTVVGSSTFVDSWQDQANYLRFGPYSLTQTGTNRPEVSTSDVNGINFIRFDRAKSNYLIGALNGDLDINASSYNNGVAFFAVLRFWDNNGVVGDPQNSSSGISNTLAPLGNYGRSYQFSALNSVDGATTFDKALNFNNNSNASERDNSYTMQNFHIVNYIATGTVTNRAGSYLDGTLVGTVTSYGTTNFDMTDPSRVFHLGRRYFGATTTGYLHGSFDLLEYILVQVGSDGVTDTIRQKVEGYLAWKYALQGNLPSSHPYKSAPPTS